MATSGTTAGVNRSVVNAESIMAGIRDGGFTKEMFAQMAQDPNSGFVFTPDAMQFLGISAPQAPGAPTPAAQ